MSKPLEQKLDILFTLEEITIIEDILERHRPAGAMKKDVLLAAVLLFQAHHREKAQKQERQIQEAIRLNNEQKVRLRKDGCACNSCQLACRKKPGWFLPGEVEKVAKFLKMPLEKLFKEKLGIDFFGRGEVGKEYDKVFILAPANVAMQSGEVYPFSPFGQCIFYKDGICEIHEVKPFECREFTHLDNESEAIERHSQIADAWREHQKQIIALYGEAPVFPEPTVICF